MIKNFFPNKTALYALVAACFVVCVTMGVRQTFGLYSSEFEISGGTSNTNLDCNCNACHILKFYNIGSVTNWWICCDSANCLLFYCNVVGK